MSDRIPQDVLSDVLTNPELSLEDIVRCTCVCKTWYSLITSPAFVSLHCKRVASIATQESLFLVRKYETSYSNIEDESFSIHLDNDSFQEHKSLDFSSEYPHFDIINCVNGLVCMSHKLNSHTDDIVLWNPSIQKYLRLPQPLDQPYASDETPIRSIGFGFDAATNDFKVVRVLHYWWRKSGARYHSEVYDLSLGCWRRINPVGLNSGYEFFNQAFLKEVVHWIASDWNESKRKMIVSFDTSDEVFGSMSVPDCLTPRWNLYVSVMGESLSLSYNELCGQSAICCIWVMKQYGVADSWTKQFSVSLSFLSQSPRVIGFRANGAALMVDRGERALSCYNLEKNFLKRLIQFPSVKFDVVNFTESLALLGVKGTHGMQTETESKVNSKGTPDVQMEKKIKVEINCE